MSGPPALQALLEEGVAQGVFPAGQAVVLLRGKVAFEGCAGACAPETLFDLASLTKVMCTTAAFISLWNHGKFGPSTRVSRVLPDSAVGKTPAVFSDLLYHRTGLPAFEPYFVPVLEAHPELLSADCPPEARLRAREAVVAAAKATAPTSPLGAAAVYSDVGFILLGEAVARVGEAPLDAVFEERVAGPLELTAHFRRLSQPKAAALPIAPTGQTRPREPAPGQEQLWPSHPGHPSMPGEVDDDNAWAMDGVAGHAGLFGTARDVARFGQVVLDDLNGAGKLAPADLWQRAIAVDLRTPGSTRALGFDTPTPAGREETSSAGRLIGRRDPGAVGHLGFTGVSLWVDLARQLVVGLCTNRTLLGRANVGIREFRPRFHDQVVERLGLAG